MRNVTGHTTVLDNPFLDGMRQIGDPPADQVAHSMCETSGHAALATLIRDAAVFDQQTGEVNPAVPDVMRSYLHESGRLPSWRVEAKIQMAQDFFLLYGISASTLLATASLPHCYEMRYGTEVLRYTKFLQVDTRRRVQQTAQMIMDVMTPGGLADVSRPVGVQTAQKVRVMHATIRHMFTEDDATQSLSRAPGFGVPINQEDLAFTLMTFSYVMIEGFGKLGVPMSLEQKDAYVHCWNVIGFLMGIREDLLPDRYTDAKELFDTVRARQSGPSEAGQLLSRALLEMLESFVPHELKSLPLTLTRLNIGKQAATALALPSPGWRARIVLALVRDTWALAMLFYTRFAGSGTRAQALESLHRMLLDRMGKLPGSFNIPPAFMEQWFPDLAAESAGAATTGATPGH